jgi:hypothetical protein
VVHVAHKFEHLLQIYRHRSGPSGEWESPDPDVFADIYFSGGLSTATGRCGLSFCVDWSPQAIVGLWRGSMQDLGYRLRGMPLPRSLWIE